MNLGLRGWRGLILEEGRFSKYSLLLYMSLAGIFTAVCLKLHVWFLFLRNEPADCQGADSLPAARVLQPHMALSKLLWQNTCQHWNTAGIDTYVSQCLVYTLVPPVLLPLLGGRMKVFLFIVLLSLSQPPCPQWTPVPPSSPKIAPCVSSQTALVPSMWMVPLPTPTVAGHTQSRAERWGLSVSCSLFKLYKSFELYTMT